jgi:DNA-binding MarR family transcriptional regulator
MGARPDRETLLTALGDLLRDAAVQAVLIHQRIADRSSLNPTDIKCLDLARTEQGVTAGRMAEVTGLSTSAITAVLDRMERAGFIERHRDPDDRRRVFVVSTGRREADATREYELLRAAARAPLASYDDEQLSLFLTMLREVGNSVGSAFGPAAGTGPDPAAGS